MLTKDEDGRFVMTCESCGAHEVFDAQTEDRARALSQANGWHGEDLCANCDGPGFGDIDKQYRAAMDQGSEDNDD